MLVSSIVQLLARVNTSSSVARAVNNELCSTKTRLNVVPLRERDQVLFGKYVAQARNQKIDFAADRGTAHFKEISNNFSVRTAGKLQLGCTHQ